MEKISNPRILLDYLNEKYDLWYTTTDKEVKRRIESYVFHYVDNNLDDTIYIEANEGRASGLCAHPHFDEDIQRLIRVLQSKL